MAQGKSRRAWLLSFFISYNWCRVNTCVCIYISQLWVALPHSLLAMKIHFSFKVLLPLSAKADQTVDTFYWGANELCPSTCFLACLSSAVLHKFSLPLTVLKKSHGHFAFSIVPAAFSKSIVSQLVSFHNQGFQSEKRQQSTWSMSTSHWGYFQPKNPVKHIFSTKRYKDFLTVRCHVNLSSDSPALWSCCYSLLHLLSWMLFTRLTTNISAT